MTEKIAHLGFIQGVITRMGNNSFLLKGWCITIIAAIFALSAKDSNKYFAITTMIPLFMFWGLDAFFLRQEHLYRKLYSSVAEGSTPSDNFTMDTSKFDHNVDGIINTAISKTMAAFYLPLLLLIIIVLLILSIP